jgi:hypothetical protein
VRKWLVGYDSSEVLLVSFVVTRSLFIYPKGGRREGIIVRMYSTNYTQTMPHLYPGEQKETMPSSSFRSKRWEKKKKRRGMMGYPSSSWFSLTKGFKISSNAVLSSRIMVVVAGGGFWSGVCVESRGGGSGVWHTFLHDVCVWTFLEIS